MGGKKRYRREEERDIGTANKPNDEIRLKKGKERGGMLLQMTAAGHIRKVGRGSKQGA